MQVFKIEFNDEECFVEGQENLGDLLLELEPGEYTVSEQASDGKVIRISRIKIQEGE